MHVDFLFSLYFIYIDINILTSMYLEKTADADDHVTRSNCMAPLLRCALVLLKALGQALTFAFDKSQVKAQRKIWINLELCPQFLAV